MANKPAQKSAQKVSFGNAAGAAVMNYLATNETMGATAVDCMAMVFPRIAVDSTRTPEAGLETARREIFSAVLYPAAGLFGLGAACLLNPLMDKKYNVPFHKINANSDTAGALSQAFKNAVDKNTNKDQNKIVSDYLEEVIDGTSGQYIDEKVHLNTNKVVKAELIKDLQELILDKDKGYDLPKEKQELFHRKLLKVMGTSKDLDVSIKGKKDSLVTNGENLIKDTYSLGRAFVQDKVFNEFDSKNLADNNFVNSLKGFAKKKMVIGITAASLAGFGFQEFNRYLTKKKTGSDAFVVYDSGNSNAPPPKKDKSIGFKVAKVGTALAMGGLILKTIGGKLKDVPRKLQFRGVVPSMPQYALLYGVTIMGRFLSSSDKNELRETATRDFLGFTSWLVLGDLAGKATAKFIERKNPDIKLFNYDKAKHEKDGPISKFKKLMKSNLRTQEEVLYKETGDVNKKFKESLKGLAKDSKARKTIKYLNIAQISGYAYSGLLLGVLIPIINKKITNAAREKQVAKQNGENTINFSQTQFLKDKSKSFGAAGTFSNFTN